MDVDYMFLWATAAFGFGLSLATYRWFALHNGWPMGEWQAHRPGLPIAIGVFAMLFAMLFGLARGGPSLLLIPILGLLCALTWTAIMRVGAQSALFLAPASMIGLLGLWYLAASQLEPRDRTFIDDSARPSRTSLPAPPPASAGSDARPDLARPAPAAGSTPLPTIELRPPATTDPSRPPATITPSTNPPATR